ncbi:FhaA domain-containing protein [Micromonospora sp. LOL_024]|uniref:FhaA domain-containing protein n=1 Tax=Micromonospora sp. LOL_024 TaxID=3345412 RepID=UPI003A897E0B
MSSGPEEEPVSVLQRFEKRLEGLVEGAFAKVFKGVVHPVEILNAMQREAEAHKAILAGGRTLVPNRYVIDLSPYDHSRLAPYAAALAQELAQSQAEFIGEQAWTVYGDVIVEIERGEGLDTGMFRVTAEVYTGGDVAPVSAPGYDAGPSGYDAGPPAYPAYDQGGGYGPPPSQGGTRNVRLVSGDGRTYPLQMGSTVIGRGDQANLRLPDVGISRRHARLDFDGGQVVLTDLGSTNGTMVNGQRVSAVALNPGDMVQLGTTTLTFRVDG